MTSTSASSLLARRIGSALEGSFTRAYGRFRVKPERYLHELRKTHGLPLASFRDVYTVHPAALDHVAERTISGAKRLAVVQGASLGWGGVLTALPDVSALGVITFRLIQKLGLIYGFDYSTEDARPELWLAVASAAGVDAGREWVQKQVIRRLVERIAEKAGADLAEKLSAGLVPVLGAGLGGVLNAYFISGWGRRSHGYFRSRHLELRGQRTLAAAIIPSSPRLLPTTESPLSRHPKLVVP